MNPNPSNPLAATQTGTTASPTQPRFGRIDLGMDKVSDGIDRSVAWLLGQQDEQGYWCGELEADSMLEADYVFMHTLLGKRRRRMEQLSRGAIECELRREVLLCAEVDGVERGASAAGEGA
jgi:hypothetical protein